jgi:MIP family channel proteins
MSNKLSTCLLAEFIGTFALIFIGAGAGAMAGHLVGVALAHGLVILSFAYAYGHISGAYLNPAVTLGAWVTGHIEATRALSYMVVQVIGGIAAAFVLKWLLGAASGLGATRLAHGLDLHGSTINIDTTMGIVIELIITFFLTNAVLNAPASGNRAGAGIAIGLTLTFCILFTGPLTGGSANPARSIGPDVALGVYDDLWVYIVGPASGGLLAGLLHRYVLTAPGSEKAT